MMPNTLAGRPVPGSVAAWLLVQLRVMEPEEWFIHFFRVEPSPSNVSMPVYVCRTCDVGFVSHHEAQEHFLGKHEPSARTTFAFMPKWGFWANLSCTVAIGPADAVMRVADSLPEQGDEAGVSWPHMSVLPTMPALAWDEPFTHPSGARFAGLDDGAWLVCVMPRVDTDVASTASAASRSVGGAHA